MTTHVLHGVSVYVHVFALVACICGGIRVGKHRQAHRKAGRSTHIGTKTQILLSFFFKHTQT